MPLFLDFTLSYFRELLSPLFTKVVVALIVLFAGFVIGRLLGRLAAHLLHEVELNSIVRSFIGISLSLDLAIGTVISYVAYFITFVLVLDQLGIKTQALTIIAWAFFAVILLSLFLAVRDVVPNLLAGLRIQKRKMLRQGELISFRNSTGKVRALTLMQTELETEDGNLMVVPNALLMKEAFSKLGEGTKKREERA